MSVCIALAASGCSRQPRHEPLPAGSVVVALGDSLTYGTGASPETSYPDLLAARTQWTIVNAGVPGETSAQGCARLPALIEEHRPRLVLVMLGGNDFLRRRPDHDVKAALASCVKTAAASGVQLVLLSVPKFGIGGLSAASLYDDVGKELAQPVLDPGVGKVLSDANLRADPIHPNAAGYRVVADNVEKGLRVLGYLGAR